MRSQATELYMDLAVDGKAFQYRKRYEVTCDKKSENDLIKKAAFQYRKRYEVTCDVNRLWGGNIL